MKPKERVMRWLDEAIIGLDLCPFAAKARRHGGVRIAVFEALDPIHAVHATLEEAQALLQLKDASVQTTLVTLSEGLEDFETYLDVVATVEDALIEGGAEGMLQVATFHPNYTFEGEDPEGISHFTNRAPYPILHLLREDDVSEAVDRHPDPHNIPTANIAKLQSLGTKKVRELWRCWSAMD